MNQLENNYLEDGVKFIQTGIIYGTSKLQTRKRNYLKNIYFSEISLNTLIKLPPRIFFIVTSL